MLKSFKIFYIIVFIGLMSITFPKISFSQEEHVAASSTTQELSGEVLSVDKEESTIVLKYLKDVKEKTYEAELFQVPAATEITKDANTMDLAKIKVGDQAQLKYAEDNEGTKKAIAITIGK